MNGGSVAPQALPAFSVTMACPAGLSFTSSGTAPNSAYCFASACTTAGATVRSSVPEKSQTRALAMLATGSTRGSRTSFLDTAGLPVMHRFHAIHRLPRAQ